MLQLKTFFIFILFNLLVIYSYAQEQYVQKLDPYIEYVESSPVKSKHPEGVKTVILEQDYNGEEVNFVKNFDDKNRLYEYHTEPKSKAEHASYTCEYKDKLAKIGTYIVYSSGDNVDYKIIHKTNEYGKPINQTKFNGNGEILEEVIWKYDTKGLLTYTSYTKNKNKKLINEWFYTYDDEGRMLKTTIKDAKSKVVHEWVYSYNQNKKDKKTSKSQTNVCIWTEDKDDYFLINEQRVKDKGKIEHSIKRYHKKDSTIEAHLIYNENNKLTYKIEYDHSLDKPMLIKYFSGGKVSQKGVFKYENNLKTNYSEYDSKNNLIEHHLYIYNDKGFMTRARIYNKKNKNEETIVIKYKE